VTFKAILFAFLLMLAGSESGRKVKNNPVRRTRQQCDRAHRTNIEHGAVLVLPQIKVLVGSIWDIAGGWQGLAERVIERGLPLAGISVGQTWDMRVFGRSRLISR